MKKLVAILLAGVLAFTISIANNSNSVATAVHFSDVQIKENNEYVNVIVDDCKYLRNDGYPMLPYYVKTYTFPVGTKIEEIKVEARNVETIKLDKKIAPAPPAVSLNMKIDNYRAKEGEIYSKDVFYPEDWYSYKIGVGIKDGKRVVFLSIHLYPLKYNAVRNEALYAHDINVRVKYELPVKAMFTNDEYDLLIICPEKFVDELQPLKEHKESHGIKTLIETVESITSSYSGRDNAEKVKYAIKDAIEQYGIKYVMLVGGLDSPIKSDTWLVPVRYSHLDDQAEKTYLTDLYFADVYKYEDGQPVFDDWDSNGNGVFAEWSMRGKDVLDLYPDVYVGRLACRNEKEVEIMVNKIIYYEENAAGSEWFKRAILVGGDTFDDTATTNFYEGEVANQVFFDNLPSDFEAIKVWYSEGNMKQSNVIAAISQGGGFLHFSGHGSPGEWMAKSFEGGKAKYILGLDIYHMPLLKNEGMYPVTVIGGCHNSMFNATLYDSVTEIIKSIILKYILGKPFTTWYWIPCPECFGWFIVRQPAGGAIASIGCTGLGYGSVGDYDGNGIPDCVEYVLGWAEVHLAKFYAEGIDILGMTHSTVLTEYINTFDCNGDRIDRKTVEEWVLLGDPTLKIGGYE